MDNVDSGLAGGHAPHHWNDTLDRQFSQSFSSTAKGLRNAPGENNCFLNSAVQVFWHIDVFRRSYRRLSGHLCMGHSCIFCALKVIFTQFQYSDQSSLQPNALRKALANTFAKQERFQLGHMDDAAECFENILNRIHYHIANSHNEDTCNAPHCIPHQKFAMTVSDQLVCPCGSTSVPHKFHEMVHYVSANALVSQSRCMQENGDMLHPNKFGLLLRNAAAIGNVRDCPSNCGKQVQIRRTLLNVPDVVSVGLVWGSDKPDPELTREVARTIGTTLLLPDIFHSVMCNDGNKLPRLQLSSLVCYYGKHYSTFVWHTKLQTWVYFDDATVREIGTRWEQVVDKIVKSHYQILLLIYSNPSAQPVPTDTAPSSRVMAPGYSMTPNKGSQEEDKKQSKDQTGSQKDSRRSLTPSLDKMNINQSGDIPNKASNDKEQLERKSSFEHRRQSSFMIAVTKQKAQEDAIYAVPHNNSKLMNMQKDISKNDLRNNPNFRMPSQNVNQGDMVDGPESMGSYDYTLSRSDQYRRPGLSSPDHKMLPLTPNFSRTNEAQRKDSFKKGKGKVGADVVRYHVDQGRRQSQSSDSSDQSSPVNGDMNGPFVSNSNNTGKPVLPVKPAHFRQRSQSLEDNLCNLQQDIEGSSHVAHTVIKPKPSNTPMVDNNDPMNRAHTPVQSGLATLPRKKKNGNINSNSSSNVTTSSSQYNPPYTRQGSQHIMAANSQQQYNPSEVPQSSTYTQMNHPPNTNYQNCLTYQNVIDSDKHSRQSSSSSILSQGTIVECSDNEAGTADMNPHQRQMSSASQDTLTDKTKDSKSKSKRKEKDESSKKKEDSKQRKDEKKIKSKKDRSSIKPPAVPEKKSQQPSDEGFIDTNSKLYIDRRMVESVLSFQKLQRSGSVVSQASTSSIESDIFPSKSMTPKDNLSSEIPFDQASLDSHKDSGYGSSDRNSSSSTGSITMNPYEQYFLSRSMIPPKTINHQVMAESMRKMMDKGSEYTQEKDLKSLVTNPSEHYNQNYTVAQCQQNQSNKNNLNHPQGSTGYRHDDPKGQLSTHKDLGTLSKEERNRHLFDALSGHKKVMSPPQTASKNVQGPIQGQQPVNRGPNNQSAGYGGANDSWNQSGLNNGGTAPEKGLPLYQEGNVPGNIATHHQQKQPSFNEVLHGGNEHFLSVCQRAEDLMDGCVLAETSEQYGDALSYCQQAIDQLQNAMRMPDIGQTSYTYAQRKSNSCLLKLRSLQKRLMIRQESNQSSNSSDSGINQDYRNQRPHHPHQSKSQHHLNVPNTGSRPPSRSGSQNSMDSLKDGSTSSTSSSSSTQMLDRVTRPSTDERVPPVNVHMPQNEYSVGNKDRSFETNGQDAGQTNAYLYGSLPRRKTQKSQDHTKMCNNQKLEADVYQDFLDNQRRQSGNHSRTSSGARTPVNEAVNSDGYNQPLRPELQSQYVQPGQAHVRQLAHSANVNKPYTEQAMGPQYSQTGSGIVPIPVAPPKIGNQSQHTEVGTRYVASKQLSPEVKPIWLHYSTNQNWNMHGNKGKMEMNFSNYDNCCYGNKSKPTLTYFRQFEGQPQTNDNSDRHMGNIVVDKLPTHPVTVQTAYSTPLVATCMTGQCEPVNTISDCTKPGAGPRFKSGGPNRYRSTEIRKQLARSASFTNCSRPSTFITQTYTTCTDNIGAAYRPSLAGSSKYNGRSQPDLRKLQMDQVSLPQRPLTPQVLCPESDGGIADNRPISVKDLKSRFETSQNVHEQKLEQSSEAAGHSTGGNAMNSRVGQVNSVPTEVPSEGFRGPIQRQRSKSESESQAQQPQRPKSVLSKKSKNGSQPNKPRKSVTFSANICLVAAVDDWHSLVNGGHVTQTGNDSDEGQKVEATLQFSTRRSDEDDSSSSNSPVEVIGEGACTLCHKKGVEVGQSYCAKCTYYMSKFTSSR